MIVNLRSLDRATDETRAAGTQGEQGAATVIVAGLTAGLVVVTALCCGIAGILATDRRADTAADLAVLAGAAAQWRGVDPCSAAAETARRLEASVDRCRVLGDDSVQVDVSLPVEAAGLALVGRVHARARAGAVASDPEAN